MLQKSLQFVSLALLSTSVGYAAWKGGGDPPEDAAVVFLLVGAAALCSALTLRGQSLQTSARNGPALRWIDLIALAIPCYVALQLVPLPATFVAVLSPQRHEIATALTPLVGSDSFFPLTIAPAGTWFQLFRILAGALTFIVIRQAVVGSGKGQSGNQRIAWLIALPVVGIAAIQALIALQGPTEPDGAATGTYVNRNHFASLLGTMLPLAIGYGVARLVRRDPRGGSERGGRAAAAILFAAAALILSGLVVSFSKGAVLAVAGSLIVVAVASVLGTTNTVRRTAVAATCAIGLGLILLLALPPAFVDRFAGVVSDDASEGRFGIWRNGLDVIAAYPATGVGLGNFYPAILRYQTSGLGHAFTTAHNDFVQLFSELGLLGVLLPAVLVIAVLMRALRAAMSHEVTEQRLFGLSCLAALSVVLLHSFSESNWYVLANALVMCWVAALSASAGRHLRSDGCTPRVIRIICVGAGGVLIAYGVAWLTYLHEPLHTPVQEQAYCRFGVCDTEGVLASLQGPERDTNPRQISSGLLLQYLKREPATPFRWVAVGQALQAEQQVQPAGYAFDRAVDLAHKSPFELVYAARFRLANRQTPRAFELLRQSLAAGEPADGVVFGSTLAAGVDPADVVWRIVNDPRAGRAYLHWLIQERRGGEALIAWRNLVERRYGDDGSVAEITNFLGGEDPRSNAYDAWRAYTRNHPYGGSGLPFNASFEGEPTQGMFDWRIQTTVPGTEAEFDTTVKYSGMRALRLQFDRTQNVGDAGVSQEMFLSEGRYRFAASVKTPGLSTDRGIHLRLFSQMPAGSLDVTTPDVLAATDWRVLKAFAQIPKGGAFVTLSIARTPSLKFDNLLEGTVWIDDVAIVPATREAAGESE